MVAAIEPPFAFLEEQKEAVFGDAVKSSQVALGLVPEILDSVDVVLPVYEALRMVDSDMMEIRDIQGVIAAEAVRVDDAVGQNHAFHDGQQRSATGIGNHDCVDLSSALQQSENRNFSCCSTASFALSDPAEIALIHLDLASQGKGLLHLLGNDLPQACIESGRSVSIHAHELGGGTSRRPGHEVLNKSCPLMNAEPALPDIHGAILPLSWMLS